jgi:hypothetical protein
MNRSLNNSSFSSTVALQCQQGSSGVGAFGFDSQVNMAQ